MRKRPSKSSVGLAWAAKILQLRQQLHLSQTDFGHKLQASAMAVSRWERGAQEPPSHSYIELGNLAGDPHCWYFWGRAGLRSEHVMKVMPGMQKRLRQSNAHGFEIVSAGSTARKLIAAPKEWCPNPASTICLRVKGHSMAPTIGDGYIVAVDSSQTDRGSLDRKIVIAWKKDSGLTISHFRRYGQTETLQAKDSNYGSVTLGHKNDKWKIIAKVLWWLACAP